MRVSRNISELDHDALDPHKCLAGASGNVHGDRMLRPSDVAAKLAVSRRTVYRLSAMGEIPPPSKIGKAARWHESEIDAYMQKLRENRPSAYTPLEAGGD